MTDTSLASVLPTSKPRRWILPTIALLAALAVAGAGVAVWAMGQNQPTPTAAPLVVRGTVTIPLGGDLRPLDSECEGDGGYDDIRAGAAVAVSDAAGVTIALGTLRLGKVDGSTGHQLCALPFEVAAVPAGNRFYGVEVSHRGRVQYAEADLSKPVALTLGA